jgi:hypothetical protein
MDAKNTPTAAADEWTFVITRFRCTARERVEGIHGA